MSGRKALQDSNGVHETNDSIQERTLEDGCKLDRNIINHTRYELTVPSFIRLFAITRRIICAYIIQRNNKNENSSSKSFITRMVQSFKHASIKADLKLINDLINAFIYNLTIE